MPVMEPGGWGLNGILNGDFMVISLDLMGFIGCLLELPFFKTKISYPVVNGGSEKRSFWCPIFPRHSPLNGEPFGAMNRVSKPSNSLVKQYS